MSDILNVPELFGSDVFNEATMRQRLPEPVFTVWKRCVSTGSQLPLNAANEIAVGAFLNRRIQLLDIFDTVLGVMADMPHAARAHKLSEILDIDREARERALGKLN